MTILHKTIFFCGLLLLGACAEEVPPITAAEFIDNPRLLEATMVRCGQNRAESKYIAECVNAREAVNKLEAAAERTRREGLEKQSERKRQALRRTQEAAAEARRRALEEQRRREREEYLFGDAPPGEAATPPNSTNPQPLGNAPSAIVEPAPELPQNAPPPAAVDGPGEAPETDLGAIREELKRRQESPE
ncbi:MAG: EexN family lipoprotein [Woeseiaceae bacterium]